MPKINGSVKGLIGEDSPDADVTFYAATPTGAVIDGAVLRIGKPKRYQLVSDLEVTLTTGVWRVVVSARGGTRGLPAFEPFERVLSIAADTTWAAIAAVPLGPPPTPSQLEALLEADVALGQRIQDLEDGGVVVEAASEVVAGVVELATIEETTTGTDTGRAVTPAGVQAVIDALPPGTTPPDASTTVKGLVELATTTEATTGTDTVRAVTPVGLSAAVDGARARSTHTGTQAQSTVTDLTADLADLAARLNAVEGSGGGLSVVDLGGGRYDITGTTASPVTDLGAGRYQIGA